MYIFSGRRHNKTLKCKRCGLHHPQKDEQCFRCDGLSDIQLQQALAQRGRQLDGMRKKVFISLVVIVLGTVLLLSLG